MANPRIVLELDQETGTVSVSAPIDQPRIVFKMLASAISIVADASAQQPEPKEESKIITLNPPGGLHRA